MTGEQIIIILLLIVSLFTIYIGFFSIRKERFLKTNDFVGFRDGFFPAIVNFWILKLFLILAGLFMTFVFIQLVIREFK